MICLLILMFPRLSKMYSEVHNLAIQELSRNIDKKFRTEPIAQDSHFTKSSGWLTVLLGCPRTPQDTTFNYLNRWKLP